MYESKQVRILNSSSKSCTVIIIMAAAFMPISRDYLQPTQHTRDVFFPHLPQEQARVGRKPPIEQSFNTVCIPFPDFVKRFPLLVLLTHRACLLIASDKIKLGILSFSYVSYSQKIYIKIFIHESSIYIHSFTSTSEVRAKS